MSKPRIKVVALGGTIAMGKAAVGVTPQLGAQDLVDAVPELGELAALRAETLMKVGSHDLQFDQILELAAHIAKLAASNAVDGIVVTQGTDTIEETAFLLDCVLTVPIPIVVIGAMRNPLQTSPDGAGNLLSAVRIAADAAVRQDSESLGVMVAMLDSIHAAIEATKADSTKIDAFASRTAGPIGTIVEDRVRLWTAPRREWKSIIDDLLKADPAAIQAADGVEIAFLGMALDEKGGLVQAMLKDPDSLGYKGALLATMGGGHVPNPLAEPLGELANRMPVVSAGRAGSGPLLAKTYGVVGAEIDLAERGVISAGRLHPLKARVLLALLMRAGVDQSGIRKAFAAFC